MGSRRVTNETGSVTAMATFCYRMLTEAHSSTSGQEAYRHFDKFCDKALQVLNGDPGGSDREARDALLQMTKPLSCYNEIALVGHRIRTPSALSQIRLLRLQDEGGPERFRELIEPLRAVLRAFSDERVDALRELASPPPSSSTESVPPLFALPANARPPLAGNPRIRPGMSATETPPPVN